MDKNRLIFSSNSPARIQISTSRRTNLNSLGFAGLSQANFGLSGYQDLNGKCTARSFRISSESFCGNPDKIPILFRQVLFLLTLTGYSGITRGYVDFGNVFVSRFRVDRVCLVGVQKGRCQSLPMTFSLKSSRHSLSMGRPEG